jgi:ATP-dependent RNA helicase RhlE
MKFENLNIIEPILKALISEGYTSPTPIQERTIPTLLEGKDLVGCAQTGTGKTAAFAIPILQLLYSKQKAFKGPRSIKALILAPTRELAIQIGESFTSYGKYLGLRNTVIFGGVSQKSQTDALRAGVDILVATPGRLLDLMQQKYISLQHIEYFVLDEADRMLDMGFGPDVKRIIAKLPKVRQTMLFSATMPEEIAKLVDSILIKPVKVAVNPVSSTIDTIKQSVYFVEKRNKKALLIHLLKDKSIESVLVFSRTKHGANKITEDLGKAGIEAQAIHGNKSQNARQIALNNFKEKKIRVLVATDIAARGIDVDELSHVINFDIPEVPETYVHRIGRTGRAGAEGVALSFCDEEERQSLKDIEKTIKKSIPVITDHPYPMISSSVAVSTLGVVAEKDVKKKAPAVRARKNNYYRKKKKQSE